MLTGWRFDMDGKKATTFGTVCKALGVQFDLSSSGENAENFTAYSCPRVARMTQHKSR